MDRNRFRPDAEALEGRKLLSFFGHSNKINNYNNTAYAVEIVRSARVDRLPGYLGSLQAGRVLPKDTVLNLEADLQAIESKLTPAPSAVLNEFNHTLRSTIPHASLSVADAVTLNQNLGNILTSSGADPAVTADFQANMNDLARFDSSQSNPAQLASNDYGLIAQLVQGIGVPMRAPAAPSLLPADTIPPAREHITSKPQPRLFGNYDLGTTVKIIDSNGNVLGTSAVASTGRYIVTLSTPLSPGTYQLRAQAVNNLNGNLSYPSAPLTLTVVQPVPQGPKARR
jgi:hypothetical protein